MTLPILVCLIVAGVLLGQADATPINQNRREC
jgi:hypothetical protein